MDKDSLGEPEECPPDIEQIIREASRNVESFGREAQAAAQIGGTMAAMRQLMEEHRSVSAESDCLGSLQPRRSCRGRCRRY